MREHIKNYECTWIDHIIDTINQYLNFVINIMPALQHTEKEKLAKLSSKTGC